MSALCDRHQAEFEKWLDYRGRSDLGIRIQIIGTGAHTIPSWTRTRELVNRQVRAIRAECAAHRTIGAS